MRESGSEVAQRKAIHWRLHGRRKRRIFRGPVDARYAMNPLARKALLFALFSLLLGRETACLGSQGAAADLPQRGERVAALEMAVTLEPAVHGWEDVGGEVLKVAPALIAIDPGSYDALFLFGLPALNPDSSGYQEQCASLAPGTLR